MKSEIAICIITYNRLEKLKLCIESIVKQKTNFKYDIIIVDNDSESSIKKPVQEISVEKKVNIKYYIENKKGIPFARNKCVEVTKNNYEYLIFIDDDEEASDNWLNSLVRSIKEFNCDVVIGPVLSQFNHKTYKSINVREFFNRKRYDSGFIMKNGRTGNMIAYTELFKKYNQPFEVRFNKMGGSDSHFFRKIYKDGFITKWNDEAIVKEIVPAQRTKISWIIKRMMRVGASNAFSDILDKNYKKISIKNISSIINFLINTTLAPIALIIEIISNKPIFIRHISKIFKNVGYFFGTIRIKIDDYK